MENILQGITPLIEILCAFFFVLAFGSFRDKVLVLLGYEHNYTEPIDKLLVKKEIISEGSKQLIGKNEANLLTKSQLDVLKKTVSILDDEDIKFKKSKEDNALGTTLFFNRVCIFLGLYCVFILALSALNLSESSYSSLLVFSVFNLLVVVILIGMDAFYAFSKPKEIMNISVWISFLKLFLIFFLGLGISLVYHFVFSNSYPCPLSTSKIFQILLVSGIPLVSILFYFFLYFILFRRSMKGANEARKTFESVIITEEKKYQDANVGLNAILGLGLKV